MKSKRNGEWRTISLFMSHTTCLRFLSLSGQDRSESHPVNVRKIARGLTKQYQRHRAASLAPVRKIFANNPVSFIQSRF